MVGTHRDGDLGHGSALRRQQIIERGDRFGCSGFDAGQAGAFGGALCRFGGAAGLDGGKRRLGAGDQLVQIGNCRRPSDVQQLGRW
ncbi:hypothetical protein [Sandarakinorhabdus sp.]|uniref:hypothetical protein n=1 Tax=Sandarakinorhabdus sp. TaxID=1916663 RepID=UPI003F72885D